MSVMELSRAGMPSNGMPRSRARGFALGLAASFWPRSEGKSDVAARKATATMRATFMRAPQKILSGQGRKDNAEAQRTQRRAEKKCNRKCRLTASGDDQRDIVVLFLGAEGSDVVDD